MLTNPSLPLAAVAGREALARHAGAYRARLLGGFSITLDDVPLKGLEASKAQELLAYLLLQRGRAPRREALSALLWGDATAAQSRKYLRQALWQLQAALEPPRGSAAARLLQVGTDWLRVNPGAVLWVDVEVIEQAFARVEGTPGSALDTASAQAIQVAAAAYSGDLLTGWYQDWCVFDRQRILDMFLMLLEKLMDFCEAHQAYEAGLSYGNRILSHDQAREGAHQRLMRLHYLAGDRTASLRQYRRCVEALARELEVEPSQRTVALYDQIRADCPDGPPTDTACEAIRLRATGAGEALGLDSLLGELEQIRLALSSIERRLWAELQRAEQASERHGPGDAGDRWLHLARSRRLAELQ